MSSYWWPLGRSAAAAATTNQSPTPSAARSGATGATNTTRDGSSSAAQRPPSSSVDLRHLAQTAFHTSLDNLLVEATKHRSLVVLRDAVLETRQRRYDPVSLFDTLCIACSLLAERSGSSGARSFSNASSVAQAAAGEALEGARKALLSSSSNSNTGAPSTSNTNVNSSGGGAAGGGQGHTSASAGAAALESSFKASSSLSALAPMRATPPLGGATGGGTAAGAAASTATHSLHYRHRGAARGLLLQSISDVGKLIALGLLPVSLSVGQRVADLVREISFVAPAGAASHRQRQQSPPHASAGTAHAAAAVQERRGAESADGGLHGHAAASRTPPPPLTGPVELVHDDPVLVRLLQLTASAASACQLGSPALPELYGVLLLFYSGVEANSMLEATCEATLTHHIHTVLAALRDNGTSNDGASAAGVPASAAAAASSPLHSDSPAPPTGPSAAPFAAQLQGIAFMKDICRLMVGARTKWLHLSANRSSHRSSSSSGGRGAGGVGGQTANAATALHREKSTEAAAVTARRANSASSSMAAVTASVVAAAADAERLQQQQQQLNHDRSSQVNSLTSTPMTTAIPAANRNTSFSSFGSPLIAASAAGEGGGRRSPPSASLLLAAAAAPSSGPATAMACVPERLRVFLMRAVTLFFKEQTTASPPASTTPVPAAARAAQPTASISARSGTDAAALNASPLFVQCLNDCLFSVALWGMYEMDITVPMQPPPSLFVEVMQQQQYTPSHPSLVASSLELFACTQQLALVTISTNLSLTSNAAQVLMEAHERLLQRLYRKQKMRGAVSSPMHDKGGISGGGGREADAYGERLSQAAIVVLTLWRKTLTSTTLLWDLLQLRATRDGSAPPSAFDAAGTAMGGSLADGIGHAMAAAESSSFLRIDNSRSTSEDSGTREYADTDSDSGAANAAAELDHRVAHDDENETDALSELESNNNNDRSNTGAVLVNTGDEKRPPVPVPPAHLRRRLQPLTLARPQALGAIGSHHLDNTRSREGLHDVGSPRLGMPPLARLVVAVVTLVMAYMQTPPHTPGLPSPAAGVHSSEPLPSGAAAASLLPVTPAPYDAQELSAGSSALFVSDALAAATTASASDTAHLSSPRRKRSRHVPAMPRCLCATPPTVYQGLTEAVSFVAVFGQHFGQLVETQRRSAQDGNDGNTNSAHVLRRCSSCFVDLHPYLIRCGALCLRYLRYEEDVLPMVLKAVSCWVQVCCAVQLTQQRDAYLSLLLSALRMPDPVVGHLIALAPPTSLMAGTASASAGTAKTAMAALESLVVLNHHYATREPRVPGSVAAAALASDQMGDSSAQSRHHDPSYLTAGRHSSGSRSSMGMAGWGIGWLRRRGRTATAREQAESLTRTRTPHGGASSGTAGGQSGSSSSTTRARTAAEASRGATPDARNSTVGASQLGHQPTQQQQQQSAPMLLISRGWRSPAVQHAVVLGVCRLQHRIMIMKTVHVLANALGAALEDGWALLAHSMALTEPLLHSLKRLLTWIEESSVEQEQQEQLLSDALHLRDALRSLCVNNTCRLPYDQLNCFFSGLVKGTAALGAPPAERSRAAGIAMTGNSWSAGFEGGEATLVAGESVGFNGDDLFHLSAQSSPSMAAYAHLPRHDPQGCADQWVLTSECLCLSMLAVLPFTEQRTAAEMSPVSGGAAGDRGGSSSTTQAVTLQLLQRQRYGALMRALRLWQLETEVCRIALHPRHMERWGTSALISAQAHKRVLLSCTAAARQALRSTGGSGLLSDSPSPEHGEAKPKAPVSSASSPSPASAAVKTKPGGAATASLTEEDVRALEATLTAVVGHVAAVAVHLCRSAARRRRGAEGSGGGGAVAASGAAAAPYQARQSAALVIAAGPFAAVPLVQAANAIFASPAATVAPSPANLDPSLLPFVQADAALSTAALLYSLQRAVQASSSSASASSSALSGHALHRADGVAGSETLAGDAGESSAAAAATASSAGAGGAVLDPLEHLLASPFALLDDVYAQWSQPVQRVHQAGSAVNDGRAAEGNGSPKNNEGEAEEEEGDVSPLGTHTATSRPSHATAAQQHVESDDDERNDVAPAATAGMCYSASTSEVAAAAAAVAAALPQVLASASTAVLMGVVKVVQANGEDIDGAAWESILSLLQRIATQTQAGAGVMSRQESLLAGAGATTTTTTTSAAGAVTEAARTTSGSSNNTGTNAGGGAQTVESLNTAFRALESIQHNHIPRLKVEGLHRLIVCVGAFTVHRVDGGVPGERKLHINLSAVQLLWSTADYLAAFGNASAGGLAGQDRQEGHGSGGVVSSSAYASQGGGEGSMYSNTAEFSSAATRPTATAAQQHQQQQDRLWCSLLWQLRTGCLDDRQEIRQSAMQTFFALVQTYGWRFSGVCWRCVLHGVLQPLIEVVATATRLCATLTPEQEQQQQKSGAAATAGDEAASMVALVDASTSASSIPSLTAAAAAGSSSSSPYSSPAVMRLLREFMNQPAQLEEARVTLFDAGSRLFVTHHANMQAALQQPVASPLFGAAAFADGSAAGAVGAARPGSPSPGSSAAAVSPVFRRSPRSFPHGAGGNGSGTGASGGGLDEATAVLEALLQLCGDVCVVVKGTSGEQSAVAAVHALHGLLVEMPGAGLHPHGVHLAWKAMERLLLRGDAVAAAAGGDARAASPSHSAELPYAHTEAKQCTLTVVAAIVAAVCDSFRLQRMVAAAAAAANASPAMATAQQPAHSATGGSALGDAQQPLSPGSSISGGFSAYFTGWGSGSSHASGGTAAAAAAHSTPNKSLPGGSRALANSPDGQYGSPAHYFTRLLFLLQAVTRCTAVVNSYYFPSKPQTTLLEGVAAVWPTLTSREARMLWGEVLLPAFPSADELQRFVLQDVVTTTTTTTENSGHTSNSAAAAASPLVALRAVMPPGSHPGYLSAVMDTMRSLLLLHMGIEGGATTARSPRAGAANHNSSVLSGGGSDDGPAAFPPHSSAEDRTRLLFMAPSTVQVTGALMLLHLASPAVLAGPPRSGGVPFTVPALFLQECADLLQFALWGPVLSRAPATTAADAEQAALSSTHSPRDKEVGRDGEEGGGSRGAVGSQRELWPFATSTATASRDASLPAAAAAARCRRDGVATLCRIFEQLLSAASAVVRHLDTQSRPSNANSVTPGTSPQLTPKPAPATVHLPPSPVSSSVAASSSTVTTTTVPQYVTTALQALDRLVDTLGEVVHLVMEQYEDVASATEAINALSVASTAEGMALARVAKRSLALLQRWADTIGSSNTSSGSGGGGGDGSSPQHRGGVTSPTSAAGPHRSSVDSGRPAHSAEPRASRTQLQDVVRASMESRNRAILRQYIDGPDDASAGALLLDTLHDMLRTAQQEQGSGGGAADPLETWDALMPELLEVVACCSPALTRSSTAVAREKDVRETLSALLSLLHQRHRYRYAQQQQQQQNHQKPQGDSLGARGARFLSSVSHRKASASAEDEEAMSII